MRTAQPEQARQKGSPPWSADLVGAAAAVVCAMVAWFFTGHLPDLELTIQRGGELQRVTGWAVGATAGAGALIGFVTLRILERLTSRALAIWTLLAVVTTVVSFLGPLSAASAAATGTLIALHAVVAAVVIASAQRSRRRRQQG